MRQMPALRSAEERLNQAGLRRSDVYHILETFDADAVCLLWVATDDPRVRERAELYQRELQCVEPILDGHYLEELGVKPGPIYRDVLETIRDARLDLKVKTREDEEALVQRLLAERGVGAGD